RRPIRSAQRQLLRGQSRAGAHRTLGRARRRHVARHEAALRGSRQARAQLDPARAYRRGRGSGEPGRDARLAAHAHGQRHHDRDRRRPGEIADGPPARSAVLTSRQATPTLPAKRTVAIKRTFLRGSLSMMSRVPLLAVGALTAVWVLPVSAQETVKVGELNSYKSQPAFLEPYKRGLELAIEEINKAGGVLGRKLEGISHV